MEEKELKIVQGATKVFMQYGIKSVNMDDMARHLGVSKKTIYQFVKDKEELIRKSIMGYCDVEDQQICSIEKKHLNAIDESLEIMNMVTNMLKNVHPSVIYDMEKYHPEIFSELRDSRNKTIFNSILNNMKKGQKEGYYRKDFNPDIIIRLYMTHMNVMLDHHLFPEQKWSLVELYKESWAYHIRGIASPKGEEYLQKKIKQIK
ncbi:MAG: TetR/AcrR family transcriptional regulator [Flavobacteriales bacterium]